MVVDLFIPCHIDQFFPETAKNMLKIFERIDVKVNYNIEQTCCGQHAFVNGFWDETKAIGEKFIREYANSKYIVVPSASCAVTIRNYYNELFHNSALHNEFKAVQRNTFEFTDFLVNVLKVTDVGSRFEGVATLHRSCRALGEYRLKEEPMTLLKNVKGLKMVEMNESDMCCGFGGGLPKTNPAIAEALAKRKIENAIKSKAEYIISTETTCLMHLDKNAYENDMPMKTMHIVDVLASGL